MRTRHLSTGCARLALALALLALAACPGKTRPETTEPRVVLQWRHVQQSAPLIADAYLASLIALDEDDPWGAAQARDQAFAVARQCGLVPIQDQRCPPCAPAQNDQDVPRHVSCLVERLHCLRSK